MSEISGGNEAPRRFRLSREEFARERVKGLKDEVKSVKSTHPEVLSFCLYGSMTKARLRPESDIDGYLFVDVDKAAEAHGVDADEILEIETNDATGTEATYFTNEVADEYALPFRDALQKSLNLDDEQVQHIRSRPISREIIDRNVEAMLQQVKKIKEWEQAVKARESLDPDKHPQATQEDRDRYFETSFPRLDTYIDVSMNVEAMFYMDVGGGIGEYRQYLLDRLDELGETGELIWRSLIEKVELWEQGKRPRDDGEDNETSEDQDDTSETGPYYPRTIAEARKVYNVPAISDDGEQAVKSQGPDSEDQKHALEDRQREKMAREQLRTEELKAELRKMAAD